MSKRRDSRPSRADTEDALSAQAELERVSASVRQRFESEKRVLSFEQYVSELSQHPLRHTRDASRYLRDCFDHYGTVTLPTPSGGARRFRLFDQDFAVAEPGSTHTRLVGNEDLQNAFYRALGNFVREGRCNRLVLLHGPNGSAKSTFAACLMRALEHYSTLEEGAVYRFSWIFARGAEERSIGFGSASTRDRASESLAQLDADRVSAKLESELREHPLLLLPIEERRALISRAYAAHAVKDAAPDWLWNGRLGRKNAGVLDALLASYKGDLRRVLSHVQVERYYVSRRYRTGAVTIGPQMSVDAAERQITADRTLSDLPAALSAVTLYETQGELVDGQGGVIEFSDLLKRPLDAWKYLLLAIEEGEVALTMSMLTLNSVLVASTNETHLEAFRQHPEYNSFRGRLLPLRVGYLLDYKREREIYDTQILPSLRQHVAPHATWVASLWAVLTRLLPSSAEHYDDPQLGKIASDLTPMEKARLYAEGVLPERLSTEQSQLLASGVAEVMHEHDPLPMYEGRTGASPREIRTLLLDAAQHPLHRCLSPLGVLDQLHALCERGDYEFLQQKPEDGYHAHHDFLKQAHDAWLDLFDGEVRGSTELVEEARYRELFDRYVMHVSLWVKGERYRDPVTGEASEPDQTLLGRVEKILDVGDAKEFRRNLINMIAAFAIDHPGEPIDHGRIFRRHLERMRAAYFEEHRERIAERIRDMLSLTSEEAPEAGQPTHEPREAPLPAGAARERAQGSLDRLYVIGYCRHCAGAALAELLEERYA